MDLANVLGVVIVKLKQGLLVLTCWSYSIYFFTLLLRCMGVTCGLRTRTFNLSLRGSDGSEGGGEFASMIRSRRLGVFLLQGMLFWVHGRFVLADCFAMFRSFSDPLCLRFPLSATLVLFGVCKNLFLKHPYGVGAETQESFPQIKRVEAT